MEMCVVEVGIKLDEPLSHYQEILNRAGAVNTFNCETHDLYWTNRSLGGMSENEIKTACVRYRMCRRIGVKTWDCTFQNYQIFNPNLSNEFKCNKIQLIEHEKRFEKSGWIKMFDTYKKDYQYAIGNMKSRIQLQDIDGVGLLLYYDNPDYYHMPLMEQRNALIDELNSYGFNLDYRTMGLDKLKTLFTGRECFSLNQNG